MLTVSVIIPTWNEASAIRQAVDSAWRAGVQEVIVADGGSHDETCERALAAGARIVSAPAGRARQQNAGAAAATGDVLLFLHADGWLGHHAVQQISAALADRPERWGGAFQQQIEAEGRIYRLLEHGNAARVRWRGVPFGDQGIFVRRHRFEAIGGFPDVPLMEDLMLMSRLRHEAWPLLLAGPIHVSARRWQRYGVARQTLRNWALQIAWSCGASPARLAGWYPRHEVPKAAE